VTFTDAERMEGELTGAALPSIQAQPLTPRRHWLLRAPGVLFYLGVAFAIFIGVDASSLQSYGGRLMTELIWWPLAGIWGIRFVGAGIVARMRFGQRNGCDG